MLKLGPPGHAGLPARRHRGVHRRHRAAAVDDTYRRLALDSATGLLWADGCVGPPVQRVFRVVEPEIAEWAHGRASRTCPPVFCNGP